MSAAIPAVTTESNESGSQEDTPEIEEVIEVSITLPDGTEWKVPNGAYMGDTADFLRSLLSETKETCHLTSYSFVVIGNDGSDDTPLNDFQELGYYISSQEQKSLRLRLKLENYTVRSVREHLKRCRELLKYPRYLASITPVEANDVSKTNSSDIATKEADAAPTVDDIIKSRVTLGSFYNELLSRCGKPDAACMSNAESPIPSDVIKNISESGWNPAPSARTLQGDLLYIEAVSATEGVLQITCTGAGFFVNRSSRSNFDGRPAANACFSHELLLTLLAAFPSLNKSWTAQQQRLATAALSAHMSLPLDQLATPMAQGRGDAVMVHAQWNLPQSGTGLQSAGPVYDAASAQSAIASRFGMDSAGPPREWNEDLQTARSIPGIDSRQRLLRSKITAKTVADFRAACEVAVVAIVEGHIAPFNPMDIPSAHVYLHNGIFFSGAVDTKDTFKLAQGEIACRKYAAHDLKNQRRVQALEVSGLHTVVQMLVDYKGMRMLAQTVIPGVLSASGNSSRLMVGSVEQGQRLHVKKEAFGILQELGRRVGLVERNVSNMPTGTAAADAKAANNAFGLGLGLDEPASPIRIDDEDEAAAADAVSVPHVGPIEGKLIKGSDGRIYVLELTRLTPRDANYVPKSNGGTGLIEAVAGVDTDLASAYLLRPELLSAYKMSQRETAQNAIVQRYVEEEKLRKEKLVAALAVATKDNATEADARHPLELEYEAEQAKASASLLEEVSAADKALAEKDVRVNPNVFFPQFAADIDPAVVQKDEATARELATFLHDIVCPGLTAAVRKGDRATPLDCAAAAQLMHDSGINMRYLGRLARLAREEERSNLERRVQGSVGVYSMPAYWRDLLETEMVARAVKALLNSLFSKNVQMRESPAATVAAVLSAVLSTGAAEVPVQASSAADAVVSASTASKKKSKGKSKGEKAGASTTSESMDVPAPFNAATDSEQVLASLDSLLQSRFLYSLNDVRTSTQGDYNAKRGSAEALPDPVSGGALGSRLSRSMVLRRICQQCGVRVVSRDYSWVGGACVRPEDVVGLVPRIKSCESPVVSSDAAEFLERSKDALKKGDLQNAYRMAQESLQILNQIVGPLHVATLEANELLAGILAAAGDVAMALVLQQKNLLAWVQLRGLDSAEALSTHLQIANYHAEIGSVGEAMPHLLAARYGVELVGGLRHPVMVQIIQKVAENLAISGTYDPNTVYQLLCHARDMCTSLVYKAFFGIMLAGILRNLNYFEQAIDEMKSAHELLAATFGNDDERVKEAKEQLTAYRRDFTALKVSHAKLQQARDLQEQEKQRELIQNKLLSATQATTAKQAEVATSEARKKLHDMQQQRRARR